MLFRCLLLFYAILRAERLASQAFSVRWLSCLKFQIRKTGADLKELTRGFGFDTEHALGNENRWGKNKLGKALMRVRAQMTSERDGYRDPE